MENPVQMTLPFDVNPHPVRLKLDIHGMTLRGSIVRGKYTSLRTICTRAGIAWKKDTFNDFVADAQFLPLLAKADHVTIVPGRNLKPFLQLVTSPPVAGTPASVSRDPDGSLLKLTWMDSHSEAHEYVVSPDVGAVLMRTQIPFSASTAAWELMVANNAFPATIGEARMNLDRFVDVHSAIPQAAETAPIRGLFRQSPTKFGCAAAFATDVATAPGFRWVGFPPDPPQTPTYSPPATDVAPQRWVDIATITTTLLLHGAAVVVAGHGAGRRFTTLAALSMADHTPVVVVCSPLRVWVWTRHAERLNLTWSIAGSLDTEADVRVMSYTDPEAVTAVTDDVSAVVFDAVDEYIDVYDNLPLSVAFDGLVDTPRVAICDHWSDDMSEQMDILSVVRPREFVRGSDVLARYCGTAMVNAATHIGLYVVRMESHHEPGAGVDKVRVVELPDSIRTVFEQERELVNHRTEEHQSRVERDLLDVGSSTTISPKLVTAAHLAIQRAEVGADVVVVVRNSRAVNTVRALTRHVGPGQVTVTTQWSDVSTADVVLGASWPASFDVITSAVRDDRSQEVVMVSVAHEVEESVALAAARNTIRCGDGRADPQR